MDNFILYLYRIFCMIILNRLFQTPKSTIGHLSFAGKNYFTCEDIFRSKKIAGETRIPSGTYDIKLRLEGELVQKYNKKYNWHRGMIWLQNVPDYSFVYIHVGNTFKDTEGCILIGYGADVLTGEISQSVKAYTDFCADVYKNLRGLKIKITDNVS